MRSLTCSLVGLMTLLAAGCVDMAFGPRLPVDFVSEDEELLGIWFVVDRGQLSGTCAIEEIAIPVEDGFINPGSHETYLVGSEEEPSESESANLFYETAYRITIRPYETSESRKVLYGYVVPIGEEKYLGVHVGVGELAKSLGPILTVPTFMLMKYEMDDEHLRVWMPHAVAFCVPTPGWKNAMDGSQAIWFADRDETEAADSIEMMGGLMLSPTIQELIAYYEQHANDEGFFLDGAYEFKRVPVRPVGG